MTHCVFIRAAKEMLSTIQSVCICQIYNSRLSIADTLCDDERVARDGDMDNLVLRGERCD